MYVSYDSQLAKPGVDFDKALLYILYSIWTDGMGRHVINGVLKMMITWGTVEDSR